MWLVFGIASVSAPVSLAHILPIMAILPVVAYGWAFGMWPAVLLGLTMFVPNAVLVQRGSDMTLAEVLSFPSYLAGNLATAFVGGLVGYMGELRRALVRRHEEALRAREEAAEAERSRAEAQVQLALERTSRIAAMGTVAAGVAHEINNPLTYVVANVRHIRDELADSLEAELRRALDDALDGAERMQRIVGALRVLSHPKSEAVELRPVELATVAQTAVNIARGEVRRQATLELALGPTPLVRGDEGRLVQALVNLLTNAAQAVNEREGGEKRVTLGTHTDAEGRAVVSVRDTGPGISEENRARILEPFFTTKPVGSGTGLGLSVTHDIVRAHEGELVIESSSEGAEFRMCFPPAPEESTGQSEIVGRARFEPMRLLVVDDDPRVARALARMLRRHDVHVVGGAREALDALTPGVDYDAILCDLAMPEISGIELHSRLLERDPDLASRFVLVTGGLLDRVQSALVDERQIPVVTKPFEPKALRAELLRIQAAGPRLSHDARLVAG